MHEGFKEFLLDDAKKWNSETRLGIAKLLKGNPEQLKISILRNLMAWGTVYVLQKGESVFSENALSDANELMAAWRVILKDELAVIE
jgi:hypothetical protein